MHRHARVTEGNLSYERMEPDGAGVRKPWSQFPWGTALEIRLAELVGESHSIEGVKFMVPRPGGACTYLASFSAMVEGGHVPRLWGVARDVSELVELNVKLQREQERLRSYARQVVAAEEKARRATAVDLHDGIGQTLAGMLMMLEAARERPPEEARLSAAPCAGASSAPFSAHRVSE